MYYLIKYLLCMSVLLDLSLSVKKQDIKCLHGGGKGPIKRKRELTICPDGCQDRYRGRYCTRLCPRNCITCHRFTANCSGHCQKGYFGHSCHLKCISCDTCDINGNCVVFDNEQEARTFKMTSSVSQTVTSSLSAVTTTTQTVTSNFNAVTTGNQQDFKRTEISLLVLLAIGISVVIFILLGIAIKLRHKLFVGKCKKRVQHEEVALSTITESSNTYDEIEDVSSFGRDESTYIHPVKEPENNIDQHLASETELHPQLHHNPVSHHSQHHIDYHLLTDPELHPQPHHNPVSHHSQHHIDYHILTDPELHPQPHHNPVSHHSKHHIDHRLSFDPELHSKPHHNPVSHHSQHYIDHHLQGSNSSVSTCPGAC